MTASGSRSYDSWIPAPASEDSFRLKSADELSVPPPKIAEIVKIAQGGRNDVLNR